MVLTSGIPKASPGLFQTLIDRQFGLITAVLLALMAAAQIGSAVVESPTNDEPNHLTAGYVYLTTGDYSMDPTHPPLGRVLAALPLLTMPLENLSPGRAWLDLPKFVWGNRVSADKMFFCARLVIVGLTILFGVYLAYWTRRRFSSAVALIALIFFAFDPNLIAHGHYVTTDLIISLTIFLTCTFWADFLDTPTWKNLLLSSLFLGCSLVSKFSGAFLLLVLLILYVVAWPRNRGRPFFNWRGAIVTGAVSAAGACLVVAVSYGPDVKPFLSSLGRELLHGQFSMTKQPDPALLKFGYFNGMHLLAEHDANGHPAYLLGHFSTHGWWDYFPVVFLVKTSTGILVACMIATLSRLLCRRRGVPSDTSLRCLGLTAALYFAMAMYSSIDIGVRHILPVYPLLYVLLAFVLVNYTSLLLKTAWPWTLAALLTLVAAESLAAYPHYLAFFNWPSGGPAKGSDYLLDSNIDWGQDAKSLGYFVADHHLSPVCTALFGSSPVEYYVPGARNLLKTGMPDGPAHLSCVVAVSVNLLRGLDMPLTVFEPLRRRRPTSQVGHSIYLYDLRH